MPDAPELPSLTVVGGAIDGYEMKLSPGTTVVIGSGRLAHMRIDHPDVEMAHVKVTWDAQLRAALPWQCGAGLPSPRVIALSGDLKRRLRDAAFRVP